MHTNFVSLHVLFDQKGRSLDDTRTDDEEGSREILLIQVVEEVLGLEIRVRTTETDGRSSLLTVWGRTIVETNTPSELVRAIHDICKD